MKKWIKRRTALVLAGIFVGIGGGFLALSWNTVENGGDSTVWNGGDNAAQNSGDCPCQDITVKFGAAVPGDAAVFGNQDNADCFAWAEFVALNWPSSGGFGDPGNTQPVQWETYMPSDVLYNQDGSKPPLWGSTLVPRAFASRASLLGLSQQTKILHFSSKFEDTRPGSIRFSTGQAFPEDGPNWLGARDSTNVWYEILVNKDIYDYVVKNQFYDARAQVASVKNGVPINFPVGEFDKNNQGTVGAIELKAAWMEVKDPSKAKWKRYKLSNAVVQDANTGRLRSVTVALVGLHILHKTDQQRTWVWATFEQIDNVPGSPGTNRDYSFHNSACTGCTPNVPPTYYLRPGGPGPTPIQVTRVKAIDLKAKQHNSDMQKAIAARYPTSVWQYYELVNVLWSNTAQTIPSDPVYAPFPLNLSYMQPSPKNYPVANTTLETYAQHTTCTSCHTYATVAPLPGDTVKVFSDFSFVIGTAGASRR